MNKTGYTREFKGQSLLAFPEDYIIIDIETTGLSPTHDKIIEVAAIKVENGKKTSTFQELMKPTSYEVYDMDEDILGDYIIKDGKKIQYVDEFIINFTGINNKMLDSARNSKDVLSDFLSYIGDSILVGHNVNFDINFLYDFTEKLLEKPLTNNFIDTLRFARLWLKSLDDRSLYGLVRQYEISGNNFHRALNDCEYTNSVFLALKKDILSHYESTDEFYKDNTSSKNKLKYTVKAADVSATINFDEINPDNPIYGNHFVFTGKLEKLTRKEAFQLVVNHGGINDDDIVKNTNYLVVGNFDYCKTIRDGKSNKIKKAEKYKLKGQNISIIPEDVFFDMLND